MVIHQTERNNNCVVLSTYNKKFLVITLIGANIIEIDSKEFNKLSTALKEYKMDVSKYCKLH